MARLLETTFLAGPAGPLEALHEGPDDGTAITRAAIICHPHPLHGGTMHNKVVFRLARAARHSGAAVLRFNFRGVGRSGGEHAHGVGEQDDLRAAIDYMSARYPKLPLILEGFSFGARVALRVACLEPGVERAIPAGTPVANGDWAFLETCAIPKVFLHSKNDVHGPRDRMEAVFESASEPKRLLWIDAADHFFSDDLDGFEQQAVNAMTVKF